MNVRVVKKMVGRKPTLGSLYNLRAEKFVYDEDNLQINIISSNSLEHSSYSSHCFEPKRITKLRDMIGLLEIDDSLSLNVIAGLVKPSGSAKYLLECPKSKNSIRLAMYIRYPTYSEEIQYGIEMIGDEELTDLEDLYVVSKIKWASCAVVSIEYKLSVDEMASLAETNLGKVIEKIKSGLSLSDEEELLNKSCIINVHHDDSEMQVGGWTTISGAFEIIKHIHKVRSNERKGVAYECTLMPIKGSSKWHVDFNLTQKLFESYEMISSKTLEFYALFDQIKELNYLYLEIIPEFDKIEDKIKQKKIDCLSLLKNFLENWDFDTGQTLISGYNELISYLDNAIEKLRDTLNGF